MDSRIFSQNSLMTFECYNLELKYVYIISWSYMVVCMWLCTFADEIDSLTYLRFLKLHTCYDVIPTSTKLVVFDTELNVRLHAHHLYHILFYNIFLHKFTLLCGCSNLSCEVILYNFILKVLYEYFNVLNFWCGIIKITFCLVDGRFTWTSFDLI